MVGAGQSALETAALLHENGRRASSSWPGSRAWRWNGAPLAPDRPLLQRLREPEAGLGSGWATWFYSNHPELFRRLPRSTRVYRARTALGPAGASWLRPRVEGQFPVLPATRSKWARQWTARRPAGAGRLPTAAREVTADHVIAAHRLPARPHRLSFLGDAAARPADRRHGSPVVDRDYQTSVPGLYVIGPGGGAHMGPVMRFVFGSEHAATTVGP